MDSFNREDELLSKLQQCLGTIHKPQKKLSYNKDNYTPQKQYKFASQKINQSFDNSNYHQVQNNIRQKQKDYNFRQRVQIVNNSYDYNQKRYESNHQRSALKNINNQQMNKKYVIQRKQQMEKPIIYTFKKQTEPITQRYSKNNSQNVQKYNPRLQSNRRKIQYQSNKKQQNIQKVSHYDQKCTFSSNKYNVTNKQNDKYDRYYRKDQVEIQMPKYRQNDVKSIMERNQLDSYKKLTNNNKSRQNFDNKLPYSLNKHEKQNPYAKLQSQKRQLGKISGNYYDRRNSVHLQSKQLHKKQDNLYFHKKNSLTLDFDRQTNTPKPHIYENSSKIRHQIIQRQNMVKQNQKIGKFQQYYQSKQLQTPKYRQQYPNKPQNLQSYYQQKQKMSKTFSNNTKQQRSSFLTNQMPFNLTQRLKQIDNNNDDTIEKLRKISELNNRINDRIKNIIKTFDQKDNKCFQT